MKNLFSQSQRSRRLTIAAAVLLLPLFATLVGMPSRSEAKAVSCSGASGTCATVCYQYESVHCDTFAGRATVYD